MKNYMAVAERCVGTGVGHGFSGAHSQGATLDGLKVNLSEVIAMLLEDGDPRFDAEFVGTQMVVVA